MQREKERVALVSMIASGGLILVKGVVGVITGSIAIISESIHSLSDFVATLITWWAVRAGNKPADDHHHYGHGKVENIAALFEVVLLIGAAVWIFIEAIKRLAGEPPHIDATPLAIAVLLVSICVDFWRVRALRKVANATGSPALEADALHFLSDMLASGVVLVGIVCVLLGYVSADAIAALLVASFILFASLKSGKRAVLALLDTAPEEITHQVRVIANELKQVISIERIRVRMAGATAFVDLVVAVDRSLALEQISVIKEDIVRAIVEKFPQAEVSVDVIPRSVADESIMTQISVIAANQGLSIHHLTVQRVDDCLSVSLDLELDADMDLMNAHRIASNLEEAIREEIGTDAEIDTHIEPKVGEWLDGTDVNSEESRQIERALVDIACQDELVHHIHEVRIRKTSIGLIVQFHDRLPYDMAVVDAHSAIDRLERELRSAYPQIARVTGHAEPVSPD